MRVAHIPPQHLTAIESLRAGELGSCSAKPCAGARYLRNLFLTKVRCSQDCMWACVGTSDGYWGEVQPAGVARPQGLCSLYAVYDVKASGTARNWADQGVEGGCYRDGPSGARCKASSTRQAQAHMVSAATEQAVAGHLAPCSAFVPTASCASRTLLRGCAVPARARLPFLNPSAECTDSPVHAPYLQDAGSRGGSRGAERPIRAGLHIQHEQQPRSKLKFSLRARGPPTLSPAAVAA